jgi:hypothetical protein
MKGEQIDLFDRQLDQAENLPLDHAAEIIAFPIDRHLVYVRQTARRLERKHGPAADRFWKTECRRIFGRLQVQGLSEPEIKKELASFAHAVHAEMQRAAWAEWETNNPQGAA